MKLDEPRVWIKYALRPWKNLKSKADPPNTRSMKLEPCTDNYLYKFILSPSNVNFSVDHPNQV